MDGRDFPEELQLGDPSLSGMRESESENGPQEHYAVCLMVQRNGFTIVEVVCFALESSAFLLLGLIQHRCRGTTW